MSDAASDRSSGVSKGNPARPHRAVAGVFQRARRQGASDLETDRAGAQRFRADADADRDLRGLPAARRDLRARRRSAPTTWSMTRRCWISCASRPKAPNTSPRSARDRWCWARPACSRAIAPRRTGRRWIFSRLSARPDQDARLRRPQPHHRRRRHRRDRFRADAGVDHGRSPDRGSDPAPARIQSGAAVQRRLARYRARRRFWRMMKERIAPAQARRGEAIGRAAARMT